MALLTANLSQEHEKSAKRGISKINIQYFSPWLNYCIFISPKIDFFHIPAQAASVLSGGINIGERLIGGKTVLINLADKQTQIMRNLEPEAVIPADTVLSRGSRYWSLRVEIAYSKLILSPLPESTMRSNKEKEVCSVFTK